MTNQVEFLNELSMNRRDNRKIEIKEDIEKIKGLIEKIKSISEDEKINDIRGSLQGYEGTASRIYFF